MKYSYGSKFGNKITELDGIKFRSKKEAKRYQELTLLKKSGEVDFFLRQVPMHFPSGTKYVLDYMVFWNDGRITWEDVKGFRTDIYRLKKKEVEYHYPIEITEV